MHPTRDDVIASAIGMVAVGTLVLTTWIWLRTGSLTPILRSPTVPNVSEAYLTGLWSSNLMVLQVLFLARVPWLERSWGRERLTRLHRQLGYWSFWLMLVHVYLFALRAALADPGRGEQGLIRVFFTNRLMLVATIGTVLLVAVVVTSIRRARRALRYEAWHVIHLWAYLGMGLALPHQLISADFAVGWVLAYWWALYVVVLLAVLVFRVACPVWRSSYHRLRVVDVRREPGDALSIEVAGRDVPGLGARPGQFLVWRFLGRRGGWSGHPYSLSAAPADRLRVTVRADGGGPVVAGARVLVEGPYGAPLVRHHDRLLLLAAGIGITPFRALLEGLPLREGEVTLVHRVADADGALFGDELGELASQRGFTILVLAGPRRAFGSWLPEGIDGDDVEVLRRLVPDVADRDVVVCGPEGWAAAVRRAARAAGVRRRDLHQEQFGW